MKSDYERVKYYNKINDKILVASTVISTILAIADYTMLTSQYAFVKTTSFVFVSLNSILSLLYLYYDNRSGYIYLKAERNRALQFVDNSFDTNFAGKKIENYFTQDKLLPGFYKLAVNCFENIVFTYNVLKLMQSKTYTKAFVVALVLVGTFIFGDKSIFRGIVESILPAIAVTNAYKLIVFISRIEELKHNFYDFFTSVKNTGFSNREPEVVKNVIHYESILAWASMPLDSDLFDKINEIQSAEWEELKNQYNIS